MKLKSKVVAEALLVGVVAMTACVHAASQHTVTTLNTRTDGARLLSWSLDTLDNAAALVGHAEGSAPVPSLELGSASADRLSLSVKGKGKKVNMESANSRAEWTQEELELLQDYRNVPIDKVKLSGAKKEVLIEARKKNKDGRSGFRRKRRLDQMTEEGVKEYWKDRYAMRVAREKRREQAVLLIAAERHELAPSQRWLVRKPRSTPRRSSLHRGNKRTLDLVSVPGRDERQLAQPSIRLPSIAPAPVPEPPLLTLGLDGQPARPGFQKAPSTVVHGDGLDLTLAPPEPRQ